MIWRNLIAASRRKRIPVHLLAGGSLVTCAVLLAHARPTWRAIGIAATAPVALHAGAVVAVHLGVGVAAAGALLVGSRSRRRAYQGRSDAFGATLHSPRLYDWLAAAHSLGASARVHERTLDVAGVAAGERVLDVCCGTGTLALAAKRRVGAAGSVNGVDASAEMIARARAKSARTGLPVTFDAGAAQALSFLDATFDVVTCTLALHHLPEAARGRALEEMARVVKPGGRIVIVEFGAARGARALLNPLALLHGRDAGALLERTTESLRRSGCGPVVTGALGPGSLAYALARRDAQQAADKGEEVARGRGVHGAVPGGSRAGVREA
ncbi:methyltransferase domain-containing protein [Anaeromyxobacter oryzae]|uniref:Methyltransferase domain-containing protein n=1 Tax=Anaeromyxobacter oryzae TaxID=2918170 RepID=A0ABM7WPZ6_9BACT|nr:methyltransferase domain-containing protein [Anaeromyxobacter oryzae]BDG01541.1 hypothetical protein AMOR_05370 [Anaeromyxobacter oryzae]